MERIDIIDKIEYLTSDIEKLEYLTDGIFRCNPKTNSEADFYKVLMIAEMANEYVEKLKNTSHELKNMYREILQ